MKKILIKIAIKTLKLLGFKVIGTHNGIFHADETMAMTLRKVFFGERHFYIRSRNPKMLELCDILVDVGLEYDGKTKFDHHQYRHGLSSAGLTWKYIKEVLNLKEGQYSNIDRLVEMVDKADTGEEKAPEFSLPDIVSKLNENPHSWRQKVAFLKAVSMISKVIESMKTEVDMLNKTATRIKTCKKMKTESGKTVMIFPDNGLHFSWSHVINGESEEYSDINVVTWYSSKDKDWKAQIPPKKVGSFELVNEGFQPNNKAIFVHANGFFSVWKTLEDLLSEN